MAQRVMTCYEAVSQGLLGIRWAGVGVGRGGAHKQSGVVQVWLGLQLSQEQSWLFRRFNTQVKR